MWFFGGDFNEPPMIAWLPKRLRPWGVLCSPWGPQLDLKVTGKLIGFVLITPKKFLRSLVRFTPSVFTAFLPFHIMCLFHVRKEGSCRKLRCFAVLKTFQFELWREKLDDCWNTISSRFMLDEMVDDPGISIQDKWDSFLSVVRRYLFDGRSFPKNRRFKHKGVVASVQQENLPASGPFSSMRERKLRRKLARWYELGRLRSRHFTEELSVAHTKELRQLCV